MTNTAMKNTARHKPTPNTTSDTPSANKVQHIQPSTTQIHQAKNTELLWKLKLALEADQDLDIPLKKLIQNDQFRQECIATAQRSENPKLKAIANELKPTPSLNTTENKEPQTTSNKKTPEEKPLKKDSRSEALNTKNLGGLLLALCCLGALIFAVTNKHPLLSTSPAESQPAGPASLESAPLAPHKQNAPGTEIHDHQNPPPV